MIKFKQESHRYNESLLTLGTVMTNFMIAMMLKSLIFGGIVFALWKIIPAGRIKTELFRERPWNIWAWLVGAGILWVGVAGAVWTAITGQ